jgi:hypothetical protein
MKRNKTWGFMPALLTLALICTAALAGCVTQDPRLTAALKTVRITDVRVETAPDVKMGFPLLNGVTQESQVAAVVRILHDTMSRDLKGYPGGSVPARLVVTLHEANVASTPGRIIAGNNSFIDGTVRLEDLRTSQLIAQAQDIRAIDPTFKGSGLAIIATAAINAAVTPDQNAVATRLATLFAREVRTWLTPK